MKSEIKENVKNRSNNRFEQATDTAFIRERADRSAETYERRMAYLE